MLPSIAQVRHIARAIGCVGKSLVLVSVIWGAALLVLDVLRVPKASAVPPMMVAAAGLLLIGVPLLSVELIRELGPFPRKPRRLPKPPLSWRWRVRRLRHRLIAVRRRQHQFEAITRLQAKLDAAETERALSTTTLATRLDRITADDLAALCAAPTARRQAFARDYARALDRMAATASHRIALNVATLSPTARLLFLPVLLGMGEGRAFDRLDLDQSDPVGRRYIFTGTGRAVDLDAWRRHGTTVDALLAGRWRIAPRDGVSLLLEPFADLPAVFPLSRDLLRPNALFLGRDLATGTPLHLPLADLTHTLVVGPTGFGKSTFLHQLVVQLAHAPDAVDAVHLVDLKQGLEFAPYAGIAPHLHVVERYAELPQLLASLTTTVQQRIGQLKAERRPQWAGPPTLVVVDEFAQIMLEPDTKDGRQAIVDGFTRLGNQARAAGIFLWLQVQHAVAETLPSPIRRNLTATISFRQPSGQAAALIFGDTHDLPADITRLQRGQLIYRNGRTSETVALQAARVGIDDIPTPNLR